MNSNRKLLVYGASCAVVLVVAIAIFFIKLFSGTGGGAGEEYYSNVNLCKAVPSDAVLLLDIKELEGINTIVGDTSSFSFGFVDKANALALMQQRMASMDGAEEIPVIYSLHYSSKNEVSFFSAADISSMEAEDKDLKQLFPFLDGRKKRYNSTWIYTYNDSLALARYGNILLMSTSTYVLESSIRHLDNGTSIFDNAEFRKLYEENCRKKSLYINHHQIGKFFSGVISRKFLKYSDFVMRFASWSSFGIDADGGHLFMDGVIANWNEEKYQSTAFLGQQPAKSSMGYILPAETIFATSVIFSDMSGYKEAGKLFMEVHKKLSGYEYKKKMVEIKEVAAPEKYTDSLAIEELVSAYCKFGERYEWLTFVREKSSFGISEMVSGVIDRNKKIEVLPYQYKGYIGAIFGEMFDHCNEESFCKMEGWTVIGPKDIVSDFASGSVTYFDLEQYLGQTPLKGFLDKKGVVKVVANIKEGRDSVAKILKPYYMKAAGRSLDHNNFEYLAMNLSNGERGTVAEIDLYATSLEVLPMPKPREEAAATVYVDSTIVVEKGPFELVDFVKGGKCYLEQAPNLKLRMLDGKRKGLWTIPFDTPLCGYVEQVDFYKNGKLQMLFASQNKLYLLDRLGRMVRGFPITLPDNVVLGPAVLDPGNNKEYSFMVLNEDNSVAIYRLTRENPAGGVRIKAPEFVKELPSLKEINGKNYLFLKTVSRLRIYNMSGKEIIIKEKKRIISPDSGITVVKGDEIRVAGADGKNFILDLSSGKSRKE